MHNGLQYTVKGNIVEQGVVILVYSFLSAFVIVRILKPIAFWACLVDKPGGRRQQHEGLVSPIGGIAVYLSVSIGTLLFLEHPLFVRFFLLAGGLVIFWGVIDDRYDISVRARLVGQLLIYSILMYGLDVRIESFGNLFDLGDLRARFLSYPPIIPSLMGVMNAFNFLDGMHALVGSIVMVSFQAFIAVFGVNGGINFQFLYLTLVGSAFAFFLFNTCGCTTCKHLKKVFTPDAGSMFLGFSLGVLLVVASQGEKAVFSSTPTLWLVLLFMTDMLTLKHRGIKRSKSLTAPDRTHIDHMFMRAALKKYQTLRIVVLIQLGFVSLGIFVMSQGDSELVSFLLVLILFILAYQVVMKMSWRLIHWARQKLI